VIRLSVRVRRDRAEIVLAELLELAPSGVEEVDHGESVEFAVYGAAGELPDLGDVRATAGDDLVEVSSRAVADDWADRWKQFHTPIVVAERLRVRPPWSAPAAGPLDIVIDPGQAFGTGAHATTRLCLELLLELDGGGPGGPLLDVGCGSGVLAIAAAKLGFAPVRAVDHEAESVTATIDNARANGVEVEAARADLRSDALAWAPTVTANLLRPLLLTLCTRLPDPAPATLIASGLLAHEAGEVAEVFAAAGLRERARRERGEWAALLLTRE
jgi:ribosomal protein L11 methyltransferase